MRTLLLSLLIGSTLLAQSVKWETSLPAAQARAKAEHKLIFMDVWTGWCGWCIKLQKDTFPSAQGLKALAKVVPLSLMTQTKDSKPTENKIYESIFKVDGFPALFLLDERGKVVSQQPGYLAPGPFQAWIDGEVAKYK